MDPGRGESSRGAREVSGRPRLRRQLGPTRSGATSLPRPLFSLLFRIFCKAPAAATPGTCSPPNPELGRPN